MTKSSPPFEKGGREGFLDKLLRRGADSRGGGQSINSLPAIGTELKILLQLPTAPGAHRKPFLRERNGGSPSALVKNPAAPVALQKHFSALDWEEGDKEKAEIMIQALQASRRRAAPRAGPRLIVDLDFPGLYSADKKEEDTPPVPGNSQPHKHLANIPLMTRGGLTAHESCTLARLFATFIRSVFGPGAYSLS